MCECQPKPCVCQSAITEKLTSTIIVSIQGGVRIVGSWRRELGAPRAGHHSIVRQWRLDGRTDVLTVYAPIKIRRPSDEAVANGRVTGFQVLGRWAPLGIDVTGVGSR